MKVVDQKLGPDGAPSGVLAVKVFLMEGVYLVQGFEGDTKTRKAAAGVVVAADLPGGKRVELTTSTDGKVEFTGVDWSKGTAAVTAYAKDHHVASNVGIAQADGEQTLVLLRGQAPATVKVSGTIKNLGPTSNYLGVSATTHSWSAESSAPATLTSFELPVEQGKPFTLLAVQAKWSPPTSREVKTTDYSLSKLDHAGSTQPITVELDLANKLTLEKATGTFVLPGSGLVATGSQPRGWVRQRGNSLILGVCTATTMKSGNEFDFEFHSYKLADPTGVYTTYYADIGWPWFGSFVTVAGYPTNGTKVTSFLQVPELVTPADENPIKRTVAIVWKNTDATATPMVALRSPADVDKPPLTRVVLPRWAWVIRGKPGMTQIALPALPSTASASDLLGTQPIEGRVISCADLDADTQQCGRYAIGKLFRVDPT